MQIAAYGPILATVTLDGVPKGKGRPRFSRRNMVAFTPEPTRNYEAALKICAMQAMAGRTPIEGPLYIYLSAVFPIPFSWSKKKKAAAWTQELRPVGRPDLDNLMKMLDALNEVVWRDDAQIVDATLSKTFGDKPGLTISVRQVAPQGA